MTNDQTKNLVNNLRLLRTERNLSYVQLGHELAISSTRISHIENADARKIAIKDEELAAIARYFDKSIETLLNKKAYVEFK